MSSTLTEQTIAALQADPDGYALNPALEGLQTEHIFIGDENAESASQPSTVSTQLRIKNFARGVASELTFFEEGFLRIREGTRKRLGKDHTVDLRFIDSSAEYSRYVASHWLWASLFFGLAAGASFVVLPLLDLGQLSIPTTAVSTTLAALCFLFFVHRSEERIRFVTLSGRAEVVQLVSTLGCISKVRRAAREVRRRVLVAQQEFGPQDERHLRAEMQAHYKLRETGVISQGACSDGTARILSRFG